MGNDNSNDIKEIPAEIKDLAKPDWEDSNARRRIAACLVYVVYQLEKGKEETVKEWCKLLNFEVHEKIIERMQDNDRVFGAVFKWVGGGPKELQCPSKVVAFSGTHFKPSYIVGMDFESIWNAINARHAFMSRVDIGIEPLKRCISDSEPHNVWIAGHSLGAAIAMATARNMNREERDKIEAHLFNPPFFSPRLPELKLFEMFGKALVAVRDIWPNAVDYKMINDKILRGLYNDFIGVSSWIPNIYVANNDPFCCSYIRYFEVMGGMYKEKTSYERMKYLFCFEVARDKTPWHLLPSAMLFVREAPNHDIKQWWSKRLELESRKYIPPVEALRTQA